MEQQIRQLAATMGWTARKRPEGVWDIVDAHNSPISTKALSDEESLEFLEKHAQTLGIPDQP